MAQQAVETALVKVAETPLSWINRRTSNELSLMTMAVSLVSAVFTMYMHLRESRTNHNERVAEKRKFNLGERRQSAINLLDRAQNFAKTGAYPAAAELLDQAIKEWQQEVNDNITEKESDQKHFADILFFAAMMHFRTQGNTPKVLNLLQRSIALDNSNPIVNCALGLLYGMSGDSVGANLHLRKTLTFQPGNPLATIAKKIVENESLPNDMIQLNFSQLVRNEKYQPFYEISSCFFGYNFCKYLFDQGLHLKALQRLQVEITAIEKNATQYLKNLLIDLYLLQADCFSAIANDAPHFVPELDLFREKLLTVTHSSQNFIEDVTDFVDYEILKCFSKSIEQCMELDTFKTHEVVYAIIDELLMKGRFFVGNDEQTNQLRAQYKNAMQLNQAFNELPLRTKFIRSDEVVKYFIRTHLHKKGLAPWFESFNPQNIFVSLLPFLCEQNNVNLMIYKRSDQTLTPLKPNQSKASELTVAKQDLHVYIEAHSSCLRFRLLRSVNNDTALSHILAFHAAHSAFILDPTLVKTMDAVAKFGYTKPKQEYEFNKKNVELLTSAISLLDYALCVENNDSEKSQLAAIIKHFETPAAQSDEKAKGFLNTITARLIERISEGSISIGVLYSIEKKGHFEFAKKCYEKINSYQTKLDLAILYLTGKIQPPNDRIIFDLLNRCRPTNNVSYFFSSTHIISGVYAQAENVLAFIQGKAPADQRDPMLSLVTMLNSCFPRYYSYILEWQERLAKSGDQKACLFMKISYTHRFFGLKQDEAKIREWDSLAQAPKSLK